MHKVGHHLTGLSTGIATGSVLSSGAEHSWLVFGAGALGGWYGGVFPDTSERIWGMYWIQHRTVTHWVPLWIIALCGLVYYGSPLPFAYGGVVYSWLFSFVLGALTHLVFDWPNPTGIPFVHPWRRHSLRWWKSGEADLLCVLAWGAAMMGLSVAH